MSELDNIVQITITRETAAIATASFQIPLILSTHTRFSERARTYTDITSVAEDFATTDQAYIIAQKLFGQSTVGAVPPSIVIGRRQVDEVTFTPVVADNTTYTVTLNDVPYTYTSGTSATATSIVTGLKTAIGTPTGITVSGTTTLVIEPTTPGTAWSIKASPNLTQVNTAPAETYVDALAAVTVVNDVWYALVADTHVVTDVMALATAIQARRKIFGTSTSDTNFTSPTHIGAQLDADSLNRTFWVYLAQADSDYPEAAWIGAQLPYTPGSNDWDFKRAAGVTVSNVSDNQRTNIRAINGNMYATVAGLNMFQDGNMSDGTPIDEIVFIDWLYARLQEGIFFRLANSLKVPFTNPGLLRIENEIRSVLAQAETNGGIDRGWTVSTPDVLSISATLRAQRTAGTFVFRARLQGSIRKVIINGFLSV